MPQKMNYRGSDCNVLYVCAFARSRKKTYVYPHFVVPNVYCRGGQKIHIAKRHLSSGTDHRGRIPGVIAGTLPWVPGSTAQAITERWRRIGQAAILSADLGPGLAFTLAVISEFNLMHGWSFVW
jgi:hypothetical protein